MTSNSKYGNVAATGRAISANSTTRTRSFYDVCLHFVRLVAGNSSPLRQLASNFREGSLCYQGEEFRVTTSQNGSVHVGKLCREGPIFWELLALLVTAACRAAKFGIAVSNISHLTALPPCAIILPSCCLARPSTLLPLLSHSKGCLLYTSDAADE